MPQGASCLQKIRVVGILIAVGCMHHATRVAFSRDDADRTRRIRATKFMKL